MPGPLPRQNSLKIPPPGTDGRVEGPWRVWVKSSVRAALRRLTPTPLRPGALKPIETDGEKLPYRSALSHGLIEAC